MPSSESFEAWWTANAPKPPPDPVTLAAVQRVSLISVVGKIPEPPFVFAKVGEFVVDIRSSPPVILNSDGSFIISTKLILPEQISIDIAGLGENFVASLYATLSKKDESLVLEATMDSRSSQPLVKLIITITRPFIASSYFKAIGYTNTNPPTIAAVVTSIVGPTISPSFFVTLPSSFSSNISFPTWVINIPRSEIQFSRSPFGTDVRSATLAAVVPPSLNFQLAGFTFEVQDASLAISRQQGSYDAPYDMSIEVGATLIGSGGINLDFLGTLSRLDNGPYRFSLRVSSPSSLANIFKALSFPSIPNPIPLPLGGPLLALEIPLSAVGISFVQNCYGATSSFQLDEVFFKFDIGSRTPWQFLPSTLRPKQASDVSATMMVKAAPTNIGMRLDYLLDFPETSSSVNLQMTCWPLQVEQTFTSGTASSLSIQLDTHGRNPPSIGTILQKVANSSWDTVTGSIPILSDLTDAISIVEASLDITQDANNKPSVTAFSIQAQVDRLTLLNTPSIAIASAVLAIAYEDSQWKAMCRTHLLFADRYACIADLLLPMKTEPGYFRLDNLDDNFTFDELAKSIDPTIDLASVPIIGSDALKALRLGRVTVQVQYVENVLRLSAFEVELSWERQNIGQIRTFANRLNLRWQKLTGSQSWAIDWEGQVGTSWHLSAGVQHTSASTPNIVIKGDITNIGGRTAASELVNSLAWTEADSEGAATVWEDTLPSTVSSSFSLDRCSVRIELSEANVHMVAGQASWGQDGQSAAVLLIEEILSTWAFTFALTVKNFRFTDIYKDAQLARLIDKHLTISTASILAFRSPNVTKLSALRQRLSDVGAWERLGQGSTLPPIEPAVDTDIELGLVILASLNIGAASSGSLSNNLAVIDSQLAASASNIAVSCYLTKVEQSDVTFIASVTSVQLISALQLKNVKLSFTLPVSGAEPSSSSFDLEADCVVNFSQSPTWLLKTKPTARCTITESAATLAFSTSGGTLVELGFLQLKDIKLTVDYIFSSTPQTVGNIPNQGIVHHGDRYGKYTINLSATIALGSLESDCYLVFASGSVGALVVTVTGTLNLGVLFQSIFGFSFPAGLLDISFSNPVIYYAWSATSETPSGQRGPKSGKYLEGFHAEVDTSIYGINFELKVNIISTDNNKGIEIEATKATPVYVVCITLHSKDDTEKGPKLSLSTIDNRCSIEAGISFFGTPLGSITLVYSDAARGLQGDVTLPTDFLLGGPTTISFELVRVNGENRLRFAGLPGVFDDIITAARLADTLRELSEKEDCGAIMLVFDESFKSKTTVKVKLSDLQPGQSPNDVPPDDTSISFDVTGRFDLTIAGHSVMGVDFGTLQFSIEIPKDLKSFWGSLKNFLEKSASTIIKALWDQKDKFAEVIALVAFKKLTAQTIASLICRDYYEPSVNTSDPPDPEQTPDNVNDGGGPDGDISPPDGGGGGPEAAGSATEGAGSTAEVAGSAAAAAATGGGATEATLAATLLGLSAAGTLPALASSPRPGSGARAPALGTQPEPGPYGQVIYDALNKDFDRWFKVEDYRAALATALQCSLEYRDAIALLRKVVTNPSTVKKLGKTQLEDYKLHRVNLLYGFSQLRPRFAAKWLDMSNQPISIRVFSEGGQRKLEVKWNSLHSDQSIVTALTLYVDGTERVKLQLYANNTFTMPAPPFMEGLQVKADVFSLAATWGGDPKYVFFAQGKPSTRTYEELPPTASTLDATQQPQPPSGLKYAHLVNRESLEFDEEAYPVFRVGPYVYWPLSYTDDRHAMAILAYDQDNKLVRTWCKNGDRYVWNVIMDPDRQTVEFTGQAGKSVKFTFDELFSIPMVTTADSAHQPLPPEGLVYRTGNEGQSNMYPVLEFLSGFRFWALSYEDGRDTLAILVYDRDNRLFISLPRKGARYIERITVQGNQVNFVGQSGSSVGFELDELYILTLMPDPRTPLVTTANARAQPRAPDGLKYSYPDGDDGSYPVLRYSAMTYWALSYTDDRLSFCILGYDSDMNLIQKLPKAGARYISRIVVEESTVRFIGESNQSVTFRLSPSGGLS